MMASPCFVGLLVLLLLGRVSADGSSLLLLTSCGFDRLSYTETSDGLFEFLAGEEPVDRYLFCGAVASGCLSHGVSQGLDWGRIGDQYCLQYLSSSDPARSNSLAVELRPIAARKFLLQLPRHMSIHSEHSRFQEERVKDHGDLSSSGKVLFAIPAAFICCCAFLCPCFRTKDKEVAEQPVLQEMRMVYRDSDSFESSRHSGRTPRTSLRAPPSPLRVPGSPSRFSLSPRLSRVGSVHLNLSQITKATQNFSESHRIGEGGSGTVYKAKLPDGQTVAIKRARKDHFANLRSEFSSEVELLSQIEHRNLVKLLGYIEKGNERIIISEFVPNGTLREHLDGQNGKFLDFNQRLGIAIDVAHGLTYLHLYAEKPVIHRDVKSSNILLTESMRAKVADFGFARNGPTNEDQTHVSTKVKGTAGYVDPEYLKTYKLTTKSDVFSYGILLLEIISGRRPVEMRRVPEERITVRWAFKKYTQGRMRDILDPSLQENVHGEGLSRILGLAFECAAPTRPDRPTMKQVVERLWGIRKEYGGRHTTGR